MMVFFYFAGCLVYLVGLALELAIEKKPFTNFWAEVVVSLIWPLWFAWALGYLVYDTFKKGKN